MADIVPAPSDNPDRAATAGKGDNFVVRITPGGTLFLRQDGTWQNPGGGPPGGGAEIDDNVTGTSTVWSSSKTSTTIDTRIAAAIDALPDVPPAETEINDAIIATDHTWSSDKIAEYVQESIDGTVTPPPTPTLTPSSASAVVDEDVPITQLIAVANVTLTGIASITPALPTGLLAAVNGQNLTISGTPTDPAASQSYVIVVNHAGGTLQYNLTLRVDAAPTEEEWEFLAAEGQFFNLASPKLVRFGKEGFGWIETELPTADGYECGEGLFDDYEDPAEFQIKTCEMSDLPIAGPTPNWVPYMGVETHFFDAGATLVTVANKATLQTVLDSDKTVRLDQGNYRGAAMIYIDSDMELTGIPMRSLVPPITVKAGAKNWLIKGVQLEEEIFYEAGVSIEDGTVADVVAGTQSVGAKLERIFSFNQNGQVYIDAGTTGYTRGCRWYWMHSVIAGFDQGTTGKAAFHLHGTSGRSDYGNALVQFQTLNPWNEGLNISGQETISIIGWDQESYYVPHNGATAALIVRNTGQLNVAGCGGSPFTTVFDTGADNTCLVFCDYAEGSQPGQNKQLRLSPGAQAAQYWRSPRISPSLVEDLTGGVAQRLWNDNSGALYRNAIKQATGVTLTGQQNADAYNQIYKPMPAANAVWGVWPGREIPDPLGPDWAVGLAGQTDETAAIQALLDANPQGTITLEDRAYYIASTLYMWHGQTLRGAVGGNTVIVAKSNTVDMIRTQYQGYRTTHPGGVVTESANIFDLVLQGGRTGWHLVQPYVQWTNGNHAHLTFRDMAVAGIFFDNSYAIDNSSMSYMNFENCPVAMMQRCSGVTQGPNEMYMDKTPFFRCQFKNCGIALDWNNTVRSNNEISFQECRFEDCTDEAVLFQGGHNYPTFVNCDFINCGGETMCKGPPNSPLVYVGCRFTASLDNVWFVGQGAMCIDCTFTKNGNNTVKVLDYNRTIFESISGFTSLFMNCESDAPLGPVTTNKAGMVSINSKWPVGDGLWNSPLSNTAYYTQGTVPWDDDVRDVNLGYVQGPVNPGTRWLVGSGGGGGTTPPPPDPGDDPLAILKAGGSLSGKKLFFYGDSTTENAQDMFARLSQQITSWGGEWEGAIVVNEGYNGQTMDNLANSGLLDDLIAQDPDAVFVCGGINDVRLGTFSTASLQANYEAFLAEATTALPDCCFVLWTPNSLSTTDPDGYGWLAPMSAAQDYTNRMWDACNNVKTANAYPRTAYLDKMEVFGKTCIPLGPLMRDVLHPNGDGERAALEPLIDLVKPDNPIDLTASAAAWASNPTNPWTVYPRALEDVRYCTLVHDGYVNTNIEFGAPGNRLVYIGRRRNNTNILRAADFHVGDWIQGPLGVYTWTGSENIYDLGSTDVQMNGFPYPSTTACNFKLYRALP